MRVVNISQAIRALTVSLILSSCGPIKDMQEMHDATLKMNATTEEMNKNTQEMLKNTIEMLEQTRKMSATTDEMNQTTQGMAKNTDQMTQTTGEMAETTKAMSEKHILMLETMNGMDGKMGQMNQTTTNMDTKMGTMIATTEKLDNKMGEMKNITGSMDHKMTTMVQTTNKLESRMAEVNGLIVDMKGLITGLSSAMSQTLVEIKEMTRMTQKLSSQTTFLAQSSRMSLSSTNRDRFLEVLKSAPEMGDKLVLAGSYFFGMEFQVWDPEQETIEMRQTLFTNMMTEFLGRVQHFTPDLTDFDVIQCMSVKPIWKSCNERMSLYALAASIYYINPMQIDLLKKMNAKKRPKPESALSLLITSLKANRQVKLGTKHASDLLPYQNEVLKYEQVANYLLQIRYGFLTSAAVGLLYTRSPYEVQPRARDMWKSVTDGIKGALGRKNKLDLSTRNTVQIDYAAEVLRMALESAQTLRYLGIKPEEQTGVMTILGAMDLDASSQEKDRNDAITRLKNARDALVAESKK